MSRKGGVDNLATSEGPTTKVFARIPVEQRDEFDRLARDAGFVTMSEAIRALIREWMAKQKRIVFEAAAAGLPSDER